MRFQPIARAREPLVHHAPGEVPAPENQAPGHAMQDHIALVHAEIEERLGSVLIEHEDRRLLGLGREGQPRVHAVIGRCGRLNRGAAAIPVVDVLRPMRVRRERPGGGVRSTGPRRDT